MKLDTASLARALERYGSAVTYLSREPVFVADAENESKQRALAELADASDALSREFHAAILMHTEAIASED